MVFRRLEVAHLNSLLVGHCSLGEKEIRENILNVGCCPSDIIDESLF